MVTRAWLDMGQVAAPTTRARCSKTMVAIPSRATSWKTTTTRLLRTNTKILAASSGTTRQVRSCSVNLHSPGIQEAKSSLSNLKSSTRANGQVSCAMARGRRSGPTGRATTATSSMISRRGTGASSMQMATTTSATGKMTCLMAKAPTTTLTAHTTKASG